MHSIDVVYNSKKQTPKAKDNYVKKKAGKRQKNHTRALVKVVIVNMVHIGSYKDLIVKDIKDHARGGPRWCCLERSKIFLPACKIHRWHMNQ